MIPSNLIKHSIANAYIDIISKAQHFIYIENQFFITSTDESANVVKNKIGAAIVERILRAAGAGERFKVIVLMPSVPAFAGDLRDESALGTRAIMEFQYFSICRGGHSIMEKIEQAGYDSKQYIRFYNLRNYDRINTSSAMKEAEEKSGVNYETARKEHDDMVGAGYDGKGEETGATRTSHTEYDRYQEVAASVRDRNDGVASPKFDSVSGCYMLNGIPIENVPWAAGGESEIDAFVSEELYIHSKIMIADDRTVICGSANLNDRSQLGYHDSEIAVVIEDPTPVESTMNGQPWIASRFAASLRRQMFRKHLGLLKYQDPTLPDANFMPINKDPNVYDWGSAEDLLVADPLGMQFERVWRTTAASNTAIFNKVFHPVPSDEVRTWKQYDEWYSKYFASPSPKGTKNPLPSKHPYGHVVKEEFPEGEEGTKVVKEALGKIKGTLVEMSLDFLDGEDMAKEGMSFNSLTAEIYT